MKPKNKIEKKGKPLKIEGSFADVIKVAVKGNPKPNKKQKRK